MIFGTNSNYMLKYQKAKAKLVEYDISQKDYPKFPLNSNELSYPVIYILSRYAESIIENDETGKAEFAPYMVKATEKVCIGSISVSSRCSPGTTANTVVLEACC